VERIEGDVILCELGSGSGAKTRWILEALSRRRHTYYFPIEISSAALAVCRRELSDIDSVGIVGLEREYLDGLLEVAARRREGQRILVLFLGSTIGNFSHPADVSFLRNVRLMLQPGDALLLGTDLENRFPSCFRPTTIRWASRPHSISTYWLASTVSWMRISHSIKSGTWRD
jgi:uncharacterized SAM-dependent methyltransferase